jgi:hypothetical protein
MYFCETIIWDEKIRAKARPRPSSQYANVDMVEGWDSLCFRPDIRSRGAQKTPNFGMI